MDFRVPIPSGNTQKQVQKAFGITPEVHESIPDQLYHLLKSTNHESDTSVIRVVNGIYAHDGYKFVEKFTDLVKSFGNFDLVDFNKSSETRTQINGWVGSVTNDKIPELLPDGTI